MSEDRPTDRPRATECSELEQRIERHIILGTWGRIHDLRVNVTADRVVVRGRTPSHYIKQLVLLAASEVLGPDSAMTVELDIQVGKTDRPVLQGDDDLWGVPRGGTD